MKAIALQPGTSNLRLADWPEPKIEKDDEIKAKVLSVGICGTDREEASGGRADAPRGEKELIIGHEMVAKVVEVGRAVKKVAIGDPVVFTVRRECGQPQCPACKISRSDMCITGNYTERGIKGRHGFQAEYVVDREQYVVKVPPEIADIAVLTEPMSVVQKAIDEATIIQTNRMPYLKGKQHWLEGKTALVAGLGPIGLLGAVVLRLRGAQVIGLARESTDSYRAKLLGAIGGTYINDKAISLAEIGQKYPDIHLILDAVGSAKLDFDLLDILGVNGVFVLTGVPGEQPPVALDGAKIIRKLVLGNQAMVGSVNESIEHFERGVRDLEAASKQWPGVLQKFITQRFAVADFQKAISFHDSNKVKVVIDWSQL